MGKNYDTESGTCLGDETFKYFFNCTYEGDEAPKEVLELFRYLNTQSITSEFTERLNESVKKARMNAEWRAEYMRASIWERDVRHAGIDEGKAEGLEQGRLSILKPKFMRIQQGQITVEEAAEALEMDVEELKKEYRAFCEK